MSVSKLILIQGRWKINPAFLAAQPTIRSKEPWELKLRQEYKGVLRRWWLGGYFDDGVWVEPAVTMDMKMKDGTWIQIEQYDLRANNQI